MGSPQPTHLVVGRIRKSHGVRGEVLVRSMSDYPGEVYLPGVVLSSGAAAEGGPDADRPPLRIEAVRPVRDGYLIRFGGVDDRDRADRLRGLFLFQAVEELAPLAEGEVFHHQLLGLAVETADGAAVGTVRDIIDLPPALLLEVASPRGTVLVPWNRDIVLQVSPEEGRLVIDPPDGLLELNRG